MGSVRSLMFMGFLLLFQSPKLTIYSAPSGDHVVVRSVMKPEASAESHIEFYDPRNQMLCALNYSSADGEHGYGVKKAAWTSDGNYFVASLTSSGGHQAWHSPTIAYGREKNWILNLDEFFNGLGISGSDFQLEGQHRLKTHILKKEQIPVQLDLDALFKNARPNKAVRCSGGKTWPADVLIYSGIRSSN